MVLRGLGVALLLLQPGFARGQAAVAEARPQAVPASLADRAPRLVIIVRHAEKPPKEEHSPHINETGQMRANKLPTLFLATPGQSPRLPKPQFVFATAATKGSNRPAETCAPTAYALDKKLNLDFGEMDEPALARELLSGRYAGKVVFVCWHHGAIPTLAKSLGVPTPPHWKDETFDQIWEIDWNDGSAHLTTAPEMLMPGDSVR
jgi:hypothetical protein